MMQELYIFDRMENLVGIVPAEELYAHEQEAELNRLVRVFASKRYDTKTEEAFYIGHKDIDDESVFHMYRTTDIRVENGIMDIEGIHTFFDEMKAVGYLKDRRPNKQTAMNALAIILEDTRWQIGRVETSKISSGNFYYQSKLSAFWEFIETWGIEFGLRMTFSDGVITGRYVDIYDRISDDNGKWFERGDKLIKTVMEEQRSEIYTALVGRGRGEEKFDETGTATGGFGRKINFEDVEWDTSKGDPLNKPLGQAFIELPTATAMYGFPDGTPRIGIVEFDQIEEPELLLQATYEELLVASRPRVELEAEALETGLMELGEVVAIIDDETNIRYKTRVFKLRRNFLNKKDKTFTFGDKLTNSRAESNAKINDTIRQNQENTVYWLEALRDAVVSSYFNEDGYNYDLKAGNEYNLPGGYYSFDKPIDQEPTKVVYVGAGKVMIANSKKGDGSWDWRTAITGDGIVADEINTGRLRADLIQSGFNDIAYGVIMTQDGLYNVSSQGYYTHLGSGNLRFFTDDDELNGMLSLAYSGDRTGMAVFAEVGHGFSVIRRTPDGQPNKTIFQLPDDVDELRMSAPFNANGNTIKDAGVIEAHSFRIKNTNQYIGNIVGGGGAYFDSQKVSLGIGNESGVSMKITALPDKVEITKKLDMKNNNIEGVLNVKPFNPSSNKESFFFTDNVGYANIGGRNGTNIGHHNGSTLPTALKIPESGAIVSYRDLNMNGNTVTGTSDMRLKKNIRDCEIDPLKEIEKMHFVTHEWDKENPVNENKPSGERFGQIAQYAPAILQVQNGEKDHYLSIDKLMQTDLNSFAIQRLKEENDELKQELADLKNILSEKGLI